MIYGFKPTNNRKIIATSPRLYIQPEVHPTRLLDFHDTFFMIDGQWSVLLEDEKIQLGPGDIAVLPAGHRHYEDKLCTANTRTIFIHFEAKKEDHQIKENIDNTYIFVNSFTHPDTPRIFTYFQEITRTFGTNLNQKDLRCSALLSLLLAELSESYTQIGIKRDKLILELLDFIIDKPNKFFSITELAHESKLSPKSLTLRFRAETGQSVHKYQMNNKLDQIAAIMRNNSYTSLKNLALNFGFYDEFHLSASFRKKFGVSPINYFKKENQVNKYKRGEVSPTIAGL
jgi:AraC-like DNA-binding protein